MSTTPLDKAIPFNVPFITGKETEYVEKAIQNGRLAGDGHFTSLCSSWLEEACHSRKILLTHSCTGALEMSAVLADFGPGDEVLVPSFTFVSTANAIAVRGAKPVFVDIRPDTLNIDEKLLEEQITPRTKAIVVVHYAGISCEMDEIIQIAKKYNLFLIEDAAQGVMCRYKNRFLGTLGHLGCFSFHETKNIGCGDGGALSINEAGLELRAEIIRDKGTDRAKFLRGELRKYSWIDIGSSYHMGELKSSFLWAQLLEAKEIYRQRLRVWDAYHEAFAEFEKLGVLRRPVVPEYCEHGGHLYYLLLTSPVTRDKFIRHMTKHRIQCVFHYLPLHKSPYWESSLVGSSSANRELPVSEAVGDTLVRLPIWIGVDHSRVIEQATGFFCGADRTS